MIGHSTRTTRRALTRGIGACAAAAAIGPAAAQADSAEYGTAKDAWMDLLFSNKKALEGNLYLSRFADRVYFLTKSIAWKPDPGQKYERVDVPKGFVTDFASIPRPFWSLFPPDAEYAYAAVIHDYLYWTQTRSRAESDEIMKFAMQDLKVGELTVGAIYGAVWAAGGFAWNGNARLKGQGERRILREEPPDPTTRWETWKKKAGVFSD